MAGLQNQLSLKQTKIISAVQQGNEHDSTMNERRRQPSTKKKMKKKKDEDIV